MRYAEAALAYSTVLRRMGNLEGAYELAVDAAAENVKVRSASRVCAK